MGEFDFFQFIIEHLNYGWIFFLMLLESTVIPVPSELVVSPAAYFAAEDGQLNIWLIILYGTLGADCGATINYIAGRYLGRPIIYRFANSKWGKMCLLNQEKVEKSEKYFDKNGATATLTGRLIPGIRHLISIPAGMARMNFWRFLFFTTLGAGVWNCILAALGWWLNSFVPREELEATIDRYSEYIKYVILGLVALAIIYFIGKYLVKRSKEKRNKE